MLVVLRLLTFTAIDTRCLIASMAKVKTGGDLSEHLPNEFLLDMLLCLQTALDNLTEVSTLTILHHYVEFQTSLVDASIVKLNNVRVLQISQYVDLGYYLLLLFLVHLAVVELFPDENTSVARPSHFTYKSKTAYSMRNKTAKI